MGVVWEWRSHWVTAISLVAGCWGSGCQWWPQVIWKIWPLNWPKLPSPSENTWYSSGWKKATGATGSSQKFLFATLKTCICVYSSKKILKPNRIEPTQFHNERLLNWVDPPKKELNRIGSLVNHQLCVRPLRPLFYALMGSWVLPWWPSCVSYRTMRQHRGQSGNPTKLWVKRWHFKQIKDHQLPQMAV